MATVMSTYRFRWAAGIGLGCLLASAACGDGEDGADESDGPLGGGSGAAGSASSHSGAGGGTLTGGGEPAGGSGGSGAAPAPDAGPPACDTVTARVLAEELPDPDASLAGASFDGDIGAFVDAALARRYPFGLELVRGGRLSPVLDDCSVFFGEPASSAADVYSSMEVIVHECGHLHDNNLSSGNTTAYDLHADLRFECERGDTTSRGGDTFARSLIVNDSFQDSRPPCAAGSSSGGCDGYAPVYLDGDPEDAVFDGGDQGFNLLMEEAVQYVNSIATSWAFSDQKPQFVSVSARDGILTFLWYIERYLRMARTEFPSAYARITGDDCWRELTLSVWTRAERYLELTQSDGSLGIEDDEIELLVNEPVLLEEIERLRELAECP
jgi:hypothetical protein